jgi:ATP-dependent DNA ligase
VQNAILDGEIVCLDRNGVSQFYQLLNGKAEPIFYGFDGEDLRPKPLLERKESIHALINSSTCTRILYAQHIERF